MQAKVRPYFGIELDLSQFVTDGRDLVVRTADDLLLACRSIVDNSDQKGVRGWLPMRYERLDRGLGVLDEIESLKGKIAIPGPEPDNSYNHRDTDHHPEDKVAVHPPLKVPDAGSSFLC